MITRFDYNKEYPHNIFRNAEYKAAVRASELNYEEINGKRRVKKDQKLLIMLAQSVEWLALVNDSRLVWVERPREHFDTNYANFNKQFYNEINEEGLVGEDLGRSSLQGAYPKFQIAGCKIYHHEAVWALAHGRWAADGMEIHHIDGNSKNFSISNLIEVTKAENLAFRDAGNGTRIIEIRDRERKRDAQIRAISRIDIGDLRFSEMDSNGFPTHSPMFRKGGIDKDHVEAIKKELQFDRGALDPIHVVRDENGKFLIADGFHRVEALISLGDAQVDAIIHEVSEGETTFFTAISISAKMNNQAKKINSGFDNQLILWSKVCSGAVDISRTYADLTSAFKVGRNTIKKMKEVHAWFSENGHDPSGEWLTDSKKEVNANHESFHITAEMEEESMNQVARAMKRCPEFQSVMGDPALMLGALAKAGLPEGVLIEMAKMAMDTDWKRPQLEGKRVVSPLFDDE